ncbi:MAG: ribonuclease T [Cyanobacteria bacterium P01_F01_bin.42]
MIHRSLRLLLTCVMSLVLLLTYSQPAHAFVKATGTFTASQSCPALSSTRRLSNPGNVTVLPDQSYALTGKNQPDPAYYQIKVEGAQPGTRWVEVSCGTINETIVAQPSTVQTYVLAASWQPSFCEKNPDKNECKNQTAERFDATSFSIHGLWPKPQYCNVSDDIEATDREGSWDDLPSLDLSPELRDELQIKMPGYQSNLHLHEWYKHGTCYSETPEEYYQETIHLLDQLNDSDVRSLFMENLEQDLKSRKIDMTFTDAFKTTRRVKTSCVRAGGELLIDELLINLQGDIDLSSDLSELLAEAPKVKSSGCPVGQVDSVDG